MPIVYYTPPDTLSSEYYTNSGASGSKGVEAEYRYKSKWGYITANYAYYTASNKTQIVPNQTPVAASLLAFANHRLNLNAQVNLSKLFSLNISGSYYSKRYHVAGYDSTGNTVFDATDPMFLLNCYLLYKPVKSGLSIGIGVYDILNERYGFIQPYDGGHALLPGPSREVVLKLFYNLNFKKQ